MQKDKPSRTAYKVALNIITLGSKSGMEKILPSGIVKATKDILIYSGVVKKNLVEWASTRQAVRIYEAFDWMLPGQFEAFAYRKAFLENQVRKIIQKGAIQVLVLGAGYDTLCWRLSVEFPNVKFFEIDHPATAKQKAKGIAQMGERENFYLLSEDLGQKKLSEVLDAHPIWKSCNKSIVLAEGLLMYLFPETVKDLFIQCYQQTGAESKIVFTYIREKKNGMPYAGPWGWFLLWSLKISGEPWLWWIKPEELTSFLKETGWIDKGLREKNGVEQFGIGQK